MFCFAKPETSQAAANCAARPRTRLTCLGHIWEPEETLETLHEPEEALETLHEPEKAVEPLLDPEEALESLHWTLEPSGLYIRPTHSSASGESNRSLELALVALVFALALAALLFALALALVMAAEASDSDEYTASAALPSITSINRCW